MFGRGMPRQEKRAPIRASTINAGLRAASGLLKLRVGPGLALRWLGDTPLIELAGGVPADVRIAKNGASAIDGRTGTTMASGTVTLYAPDASGALTAGAEATAWNLSAGSVAALAWLIVLKIGPLYVVIWEDCPPPPEE